MKARAKPRDPGALFLQVLEDPFGLKTRDHIDQWHHLLMSQFPLWAFQAWSYKAHLKPQIPSNYPLQLMIDSIVTDEGMSPREVLPGKSKLLKPLELSVDKRRYALAAQGRYAPGAAKPGLSTNRPYERLRLRSGHSQFNRLYPLVDPVDYGKHQGQDPFGEFHTSVGREAVYLVERWIAAMERQETKKAKARLAQFWRDIAQDLGVVISRGRPVGLVGKLLEDLVSQGRELMQLCWRSRFLVTPETVGVFGGQKVTTDDEIQLWAARLALPIMSLPEIEALRRESTKASGTPSGKRPTPLRFTIWLLEHRFGMRATTVARKVSGYNSSVYFTRRTNPILPHS